MDEENNIKLIEKLFQVLGKGDIPQALELFNDDVEFQSPVTRVLHKHISWAEKRTCMKEVASFFKELNEKVIAEKMEVLSTTAQNNNVIVEGKNAGIVRSTGRRYEHDWIMTFTISDGKITRNMHYYDTVDISQAFEENEGLH